MILAHLEAIHAAGITALLGLVAAGYLGAGLHHPPRRQ